MSELSRKNFLQGAATTTALLVTGNYAHAAFQDKIKVGLVGCGGRGNGAVRDCANADAGVEVVAIGDLFVDRAAKTRETLQRDLKERCKVTAETTFSGFDAYQKVIAAGADLVILATPPGFRPMHLEAAINAGKHVFMEKPVAVDSAGVRSVMASGASAKSKNLAIVAGTQRRHQLSYVETIKRIHDGAIGQVLGGQVYWNQGGLWLHQRKPEWSDTEYQIRNWIYYTWVGGDHIVEQHVHNIDVANWVMGAHPISAYGMGGRQSRTDAAYGHVFDHFAIEFEYPGGVKVSSFCRQIDGTAPRVGEEFHGTKGTTNAQNSIRAAERWRYEGKNPNPYVQEHVDLIASIRAGKPLNEAQQIAESTLSAIMGRLTAYTGQMVTWEQALNADLNLMPPTLELGAMPIAPIAIPGRTPMPAQKA